MVLCGSSSMLHSFYRVSVSPKFLSQFKQSYSFLSASPRSLGFRWIWLHQPIQRRPRGLATNAAAAVAADKRGSDTFFADEAVSWKALGLSDQLSRALSNAGLERPSLIQATCIPPILSGKDVVIASETGSGKTHGYLAPLINNLCTAMDEPASNLPEQTGSPAHRLSLVLCPNVLLCEQVVRMANGLCGDNGEPFLQVAAVCGRQGWPVNQPDIIVSTPAALLNNIDPKRQRRVDFIRSLKYVVFDEADMLLCGGFQNQVIRLINMFRFDEKLLSRMCNSIDKNPMELGSDSLSHFDMDDEEDIQRESISEGEEMSDDDVEIEELVENAKAGPVQKKDWRRIRKSYERSKQYLFVAATLPLNGKKTAGAVLKKMFPDATWASGNYLHCHNPRLEEKWIKVTVETQVDELIKAVKQFRSRESDSGAVVSRTMVFANTVEAVEAVAKILEKAEMQCYCYHKDLSLEERAKTLLDFQEKGGIFVCTDAAARGVDIPNVSHVIQADFATSAVDFLHRVGRTARAGQFGLVTSLYTESNQDLVDAIRRAERLGQPVETAFSRKRSFRNKLKKRDSSKVRNESAVELAGA